MPPIHKPDHQPPGPAVPLRQLEPGQAAHISSIAGQPDTVHRLREFGLRDGVRIEMFRRGNPCILRVGGNKVCFRVDGLLDVLVVPAPVPD
jgi:Fe2+ transport system protein FeoA